MVKLTELTSKTGAQLGQFADVAPTDFLIVYRNSAPIGRFPVSAFMASTNEPVADLVAEAQGAAASAQAAQAAQSALTLPYFSGDGDNIPLRFLPNGVPYEVWNIPTSQVRSPQTDRLDRVEGLGQRRVSLSGDVNVLLAAEDGQSILYQRDDGTVGVGPLTARKWYAWAQDDQIWMRTSGTAPFRVSTDEDPGVHSCPVISGNQLSWLYVDEANSPHDRSITLFAQLPGLAPSGSEGVVNYAMGQSNRQGAANGAVINGVCPRPGYMFSPAYGVRILGTSHSPLEVGNHAEPQIFRKWIATKELLQAGCGESPSTAIAAGLTSDGGNVITFSANGAIGSAAFDKMLEFGAMFENGIEFVRQSRLASMINGIPLTHVFLDINQGEGNNDQTPAQRQANLETLYGQWKRRVNLVMCTPGQERPIFLTSIGATSHYSVAPNVPQGDLNAALANPGKIILAGPGYLDATMPDDVHKDAAGQNRCGVLLALYMNRFKGGLDTLPLYMTGAVRTNASIVVDFHLPQGATTLQRLTGVVSDPGNWGVHFEQTGGNVVTIDSLSVTGNQLTINLSAVPTGAAKKIGIAWLFTALAAGGPTTGSRSQIGTNTGEYACNQLIGVN